MRPRTVLELLDDACAVVKRFPRSIFAISALIVVPIHIVLAYVQRDALQGFDIFDTSSSSGSEVTFSNGGLLTGIAVESFALTLVAAALAPLVVAYRLGGNPPPPRVLVSGVGRRLLPLLVAWTLVHLVEAMLLVTIVLPLVAAAWFVVVTPVVVLENAGPITALKRSRVLTAKSNAIAYVVVSGFFIGSILDGLLSGVVVAASQGIWIVAGLASVLAALVTTPLIAIGTCLFYVDRRIRSEGLDIELAAGEAFAGAV